MGLALIELLRFDLLQSYGGFRRVSRDLAELPATSGGARCQEALISDAVARAVCFYWKPVRCLQRSAVTTRLMRRHGIPARLIIGYRAVPFMAHAWVELDGRVLNDSPEFPKVLQLLYIA